MKSLFYIVCLLIVFGMSELFASVQTQFKNPVLKKFFPIGILSVRADKPLDLIMEADDPNDLLAKEFRRMANEGFNVVYNAVEPYPEKEKAFARLATDAARRSHIKLIPYLTNTFEAIQNAGDSLIDKDRLRQLLKNDAIDVYKSSDSVLAYHIYDEPDASINPYNLKNTKEIIEAMDPTHKTVFSIWSEFELIDSLNDAMDPEILFIDPYPFASKNANQGGDKAIGDFSDAVPKGLPDSGQFYNGQDQLSYCDYIHQAIKKAGNKPTWIMIQAHSESNFLRKPVPKEVRLEVFLSLASGVKGIFYFLYQTEGELLGLRDDNYQPTPIYYEVVNINKELKVIGPELLKLDMDDTIKIVANHGSKNRFGMPTAKVQTFKDKNNGNIYLMSVNTDVQRRKIIDISMDISSFSSKQNLQIIDLYTHEKFPYTTSGNTLKMQIPTDAGDGRLLYIKREKNTPTPDPDANRKEYTKYDYNGDGISDIFWRSPGSGINRLWNIHEDEGMSSYAQVKKSPSYKIAGVGDLNGDGKADIFWRNGSVVGVWYMNEDGTHRWKRMVNKSSSYKVAGVGDFNGDGIDDIFWRNGSVVGVWYMNEDGTHRWKRMVNKSSSYKVAGVGDFNGDGIDDIIWRNGSVIGVWYMNEDGTHRWKRMVNKSSSYKVAGVGDFNNDGKADILWRRCSCVGVWYMNEDGTHRWKRMVDKPSSYKVVEVGDFNGDGIDDIFWRNGNGTYFWYMKKDGGHIYKKFKDKCSCYKTGFDLK